MKIKVKLILSVLRSILNPVSLLELSVQDKLILEVGDTVSTVAVKLEGAEGGFGNVVAEAVLE